MKDIVAENYKKCQTLKHARQTCDIITSPNFPILPTQKALIIKTICSSTQLTQKIPIQQLQISGPRQQSQMTKLMVTVSGMIKRIKYINDFIAVYMLLKIYIIFNICIQVAIMLLIKNSYMLTLKILYQQCKKKTITTYARLGLTLPVFSSCSTKHFQ